jgi:hypothetical protein
MIKCRNLFRFLNLPSLIKDVVKEENILVSRKILLQNAQRLLVSF